MNKPLLNTRDEMRETAQRLNAALAKYGRELDEDGLGYVLGEVFACSGAVLDGMGIEGPKTKLPFDDVVAELHARVKGIITRHLAEIKGEILKLDPETMNIDNAADKAEIASQVLDELGKQLRGFAAQSRAEERRERRGLFDKDDE